MVYFKEINTQIDDAAREYQRKREDIHLVAVSKKQPDERIQAALDYGHRLYGENRVQEAHERWAHRRAQYPDLKLHLIGPLQSNKAAEAVALFDVIETLDRPKICKALAKEMDKQNRHLPCFIQVNTGEEPQKGGVLPKDLETLYTYAKTDLGLNIIGLMCIPPLKEPAGIHFGLLKKRAQDLGLQDLSMGMSNDFKKAIGFGATYVRVGSALFGQRPSEHSGEPS